MKWIAIFALILSSSAHAAELRVAVAANFATPLQAVAATFQQASGHTLKITSAATGKLYSQIKSGVPFDVLLAADEDSCKRLVQEQLADAASRTVYTVGRLALWSAQPELVDNKGAILSKGNYNKLAIANPVYAPYGIAAKEALGKLAMWNSLQSKLTKGEDTVKTYQLLQAETAELGFVALSQIMRDGQVSQGSWWLVPATHHKPIRQCAVILASAKDKTSAQSLINYLKSTQTQTVLRGFGYETP